MNRVVPSLKPFWPTMADARIRSLWWLLGSEVAVARRRGGFSQVEETVTGASIGLDTAATRLQIQLESAILHSQLSNARIGFQPNALLASHASQPVINNGASATPSPAPPTAPPSASPNPPEGRLASSLPKHQRRFPKEQVEPKE